MTISGVLILRNGVSKELPFDLATFFLQNYEEWAYVFCPILPVDDLWQLRGYYQKSKSDQSFYTEIKNEQKSAKQDADCLYLLLPFLK